MPLNDTTDQALPSQPFYMPREQSDEARLVHQAFEIANRAVIEDIESYGVKVQVDTRIYWDTRPMTDLREHPPEAVDMATQALQYAIGAGLVGLHPQRPYLVTINGRG